LIHQSVSMELRNRVRYRLSADAVFAWDGPTQNRLQGEGVTRDISVAGAFILTRTCPPVGATVDLEVFLSSTPTKDRRVQIKTVAKVIRVEHSPTVEGFAAVSRDFTLLFDSKDRKRFSVSTVDHTTETDSEETSSLAAGDLHGLPGAGVLRIGKRFRPV
jgi:hypothetical protein